MEDLAPPLTLLLLVRNKIECGESIRTAIDLYTKTSNDDFRHDVRRWLIHLDAQQSVEAIIEGQQSPYRRALLRLLEKGLKGFPVFQLLKEVEAEILEASVLELQNKIAIMPIKMLAPLLLLQFPSYMILLIMPFMKGLNL
jgi:hypothetical protein